MFKLNLNTTVFVLLILFWISDSGCKTYSATGTQYEYKVEFPVSGIVLQTNSYCGGAMPTKAILERCGKEKPLVKKLLILKSKHSIQARDIIAEINPAADGTFIIRLPKGSYAVFDAAKLDTVFDPAKFENFEMRDKACFKKWLNTPDLEFSVIDKAVEDLKLVFHIPCFTQSTNPCLRYIGPMPP